MVTQEDVTCYKLLVRFLQANVVVAEELVFGIEVLYLLQREGRIETGVEFE